MEDTTKYVHHGKWLYINDGKNPAIPLQQYRIRFVNYGHTWASVEIEKRIKTFWGWNWETIIESDEIEIRHDVINRKEVYPLIDLVAYYTKYIVEGFRVAPTAKYVEHTEHITYQS